MGLEQIKVELQETMGNDRSIADAAWTSSYDKEKRELKTDEDVTRIVKMLAESGHGVPFESVVLRFWIRLPIFADRQHMTHRIASHNGLSGRYRTMPNDFYTFPKDLEGNMLLALNHLHDNVEDDGDVKDLKLSKHIDKWITEYTRICKEANIYYRDLLGQLNAASKEGWLANSDYKRLREVLRGVLPQSGMTERTTTMNLRSFANYQRLRNSDHAQPEIRRIATLMLEQVKAANICPVAIEALEKLNWRV